jgi:hypothetical protein
MLYRLNCAAVTSGMVNWQPVRVFNSVCLMAWRHRAARCHPVGATAPPFL